MTREPRTLAAFIEQHRITMECEQIERRDDGLMLGMDGTHWRCVLRRAGDGRKRMTVLFTMGKAHTDAPDCASVLDCIASDASGIENARGFADWCADYGYDDDSRKAERIYNAACAGAKALKRFLHSDADYAALLFETERL